MNESYHFFVLPLDPGGPPQAVAIYAVSSTSVSVSWNPVTADDRNGIIKGYKVNYQALPNGQMVAKFSNISSQQQNKTQTVTLDNLNEFTNYSIRVLAFTLVGNGPASVAQVVQTLEDSKFNASICAFIFCDNSCCVRFCLVHTIESNVCVRGGPKRFYAV